MPRTKLTDRFVSSPRNPVGDYWDTTLPGFGLRVLPSGHKTWMILYLRKRRSIGSFPTWGLSDARKRAREMLQAAEAGKSPFYALESIGLVELCERFLTEYSVREHSANWQRTQRNILDVRIRPQWEGRGVNGIARGEMAAWLSALADDAPSTANRAHGMLSKIYSWGIERELVEYHIIRDLSKPAKERPRQRVLNETELAAVVHACRADDTAFGQILELRILTWQREKSICELEWGQVDGAWWKIPRTKAGRFHRVPLSVEALEVLGRQRVRHPSLVFPAGRGAQGPIRALSSRAVIRIRKASGVAGWQPRDLRRTATTLATGMGVSPFVVDKVLDHTDRRGVTAIYDLTSYDREKRMALEAWGKRVAELVR